MNRRNPNSIFSAQVEVINSYKVGEIFTSRELRSKMSTGSNNSERVCYYNIGLMEAGCIKRLKRGTWEVVGHIPDFFTSNMIDANGGYMKNIANPAFIGWNEGKSINDIPYYIWLERGKKWKLGEPNPFLENDIVELEKGEVVLSDEEKLANEMHEDLLAYAEELQTYITGGKFVITGHIGEVKIIILSVNGTTASVKGIGAGPQPYTTIDISKIAGIVITTNEVLAQKDKKNQIIEILKRGLSASDAAELILKLK